MPTRTELTDALIALIPEDGSRMTNAEIKASLEGEVGEAISDGELEEVRNLVVAMGAAEKLRGPGGGLKAVGVSPPPKPVTTGSRRQGSGASTSAPQTSIAAGTTAASVLTGELRNQIDRIWDAFWSGGIANPLEVLEQLTYLLFIRRLDELEILEERRSQRSEQPMRRRIFPEGGDEQGRPWSELRWSRFKELGDPASMFKVVGERVFPFLRELGGEESAYATHMTGARFTIPTPGLLTKVVELLDAVPMEDRDTKGDIYEYMLGKLATAGTNGQFRTPRHIIELMVAMTEPTPRDVMVDPACGTCGFPVAVGEYLREHHPELLSDPELREHFNHGLFHGFDFDNTMLRIGAMNMLLHGVENPDVSYRDSLSEDSAEEENKYTLLLANPPFAGSLDYESTSARLQRVVKTKKTELLFMALFLQLLKPGGRAAVIVPDGVLFGSSNAHKELRRILVEDHFLEGVVSLPSGVFRPYAGVSTAILFFTKTGRGGTDQVWFYDMTADGWSLDDKRNPLLPLEKLGPAPKEALDEGEHDKNNLPDCLSHWRQRKDSERNRERTAQSFCVPKAEIAEHGYDLSLNRYKELVHEEVEHRPPLEILAELRSIEQQILQGIEELASFHSFFRQVEHRESIPQVPLSSVCTRITKGTTPSSLGLPYADGDIPFVRVQDIDKNVLIAESVALQIPMETHHALSRSMLQSGDILVSIAGTIGRVCEVRSLPPHGANCNQAVAIARPIPNVVRPLFLKCLLSDRPAQKQMRGACVTGTITNLSLGQLGEIKIPVPSIEAQDRICDQLERLADIGERFQNSFVTAKRLSDSLTSFLMSGT